MNNKTYILGTLFLLVVFSISVVALSAQDDVSEEEQNIELVQRLIEAVFNRGDEATLDEFSEIYAPFFRLHGRNIGGSVSTYSPLISQRAYRLFLRPYPDYEVQIENILAEGDLVVVHITISGTFEGYINPQNLFAPGTAFDGHGELATWEYMYIFRCEDGKIVEQWDFWNTEMYAAHAP